MRPLPPLHLRRLLLLRHLSPSPPPPHQTHIPFPSAKPTHFLNAQPTITWGSSHPKPFSTFSTRPALHPNPSQSPHSLAAELLRDPESDAPSVTRRLQSTFPRFTPSAHLIQSVLHLSAAADRRAILGLHSWLIGNPNLEHADQIVSLFVEFFGQRKDFNSASDVINSSQELAGPKTAAAHFEELVRAGRVGPAVKFFDNLKSKHGVKTQREAVKLAADKLCENAFVAEKLVRRLSYEVPKTVETWNVMLTCFCKIRKPKEALSVFNRMCGLQSDDAQRGFGGPDETSYVALIRSFYRAGRTEDGDAMIERMKAAGLEVDSKVYYPILKTLCSVGKYNHAVSLVKKMKEDGCEPGIKVYLLMMDKLGADYRVDKALALTRPGELKRRPRLHKLHDPGSRRPKPVKEKETVGEKVKRKRRRMKQVRLLFVKNPIRGLHRPF